jgi:hypothetical protein
LETLVLIVRKTSFRPIYFCLSSIDMVGEQQEPRLPYPRSSNHAEAIMASSSAPDEHRRDWLEIWQRWRS